MRRSLCAVVSALMLGLSSPTFAAPDEKKEAAVESEKPAPPKKPHYSSCDTQWLGGRTNRDGVPYPTLSYLNIGCRYGFRFHQHTQYHDERTLSVSSGLTISGTGETRRYLVEYERRAFTVGHAWSRFGVKGQVAWLFGIMIEAERIKPNNTETSITYDVDLDFQLGAVPTISLDYSFGSVAVGLSGGLGVIKQDVFGFANDVLKPDKSWLGRLFDKDTFVPQWDVYATLSFPGWK